MDGVFRILERLARLQLHGGRRRWQVPRDRRRSIAPASFTIPCARFAAWAGGKDIYYLDPATWVWSKAAVASDNAVVPTSAEKNGTYGRFRYIPSRDLFIGVNRTDENVFIFRPSEATPIVRRDGGRAAPSGYSAGIVRNLYGGLLWKMSGLGAERSADGRRLWPWSAAQH